MLCVFRWPFADYQTCGCSSFAPLVHLPIVRLSSSSRNRTDQFIVRLGSLFHLLSGSSLSFSGFFCLPIESAEKSCHNCKLEEAVGRNWCHRLIIKFGSLFDLLSIWTLRLRNWCHRLIIKFGSLFDLLSIWTLRLRVKRTSNQSISSAEPGGVQYFGKLEEHCYWGNEVKLYERHVDALFAMFWHKEPEINYYVCTINKTFAKPGQRMYF